MGRLVPWLHRQRGGLMHWGTQPEKYIANAKREAKEALKRGSPAGLTSVALGIYKRLKANGI